MENNLSGHLSEEFRHRLFDEFVPRIEKCLSLLSIEEVWYKHNHNTNSVGNLILHLCGNVRQWIGSGIGKRPDTRERNFEFINKKKFSKADLIERMKNLEKETGSVLQELNDQDLLNENTIQGFKQTTLSAIIHVIEHFSYHTGQIVLITKLTKDQDLGFYAGIDLTVKN